MIEVKPAIAKVVGDGYVTGSTTRPIVSLFYDQHAIDALQARIAELEKDAGRYLSLRRGQHWSVIDGIGDTLRADSLDAAIDAAIAKEKSGG
ncbi:MAG: hypothetical protein ACRDAM_05530 [Casimicrobium sp.]